MRKTRGDSGREKAVVSSSFTTTAPFRGPELVNRLELVYVLSYLVLLFKTVLALFQCFLALIIIIIPMIKRVLFSLRLFSTTWAEPGTSWQPLYYLAEEWWEVL